MKNFTLLFLLIFAIDKIQAQDYQISFAGMGASSKIDSVKVENLTQGTSLNLGGNDILHLTATVGISELNNYSDHTLHIYPNPMTGACSVDFEATENGKTMIELYEMAGKRILQVQEFLAKGCHTYNLSGIGSGIYTLKIESENFIYTSKIISNNASKGTIEIKHIGITKGIKKQASASISKKSWKSVNSVIDMQYNTSDRLKLTGISGTYRTIYMLVPSTTQTVTFKLVACTDADNNYYAVVKTDTMIWMAENLKTTRYSNYDSIPNVTIDNVWYGLKTGAYCDYSYNLANGMFYGRLYNFYAATDSRNICPSGWHVPSDDEWTLLITYLGGETVAGGKLKESDTTGVLWWSPNKGATNESGFSARPGGYYDYGFYYIHVQTIFWSPIFGNPNGTWYREIDNNSTSAFRRWTDPHYHTCGFSVRCVKNY